MRARAIMMVEPYRVLIIINEATLTKVNDIAYGKDEMDELQGGVNKTGLALGQRHCV